LGQSYSASLLA
jgi:hypothetical protein